MPPLSELVEHLSELTRQAAQIALEAREDLVTEIKPDGSVVTNGDRAVEEFLVPRLLDLVPGAGIWG